MYQKRKENVIKITKDLPAIYSSDLKSIKEKISLYDAIGLHDIILINPKNLIQSVSLSYARYKFYLDNGINIDISNYKKIFVDQKQFENKYGLTKQELLEKYDYDEYLEGLKNARTL